jgi:VWFA-related protein
MAEVLAEPGSVFRAWAGRVWVAEVWEAGDEAGAGTRSSMRMVRKFWSGYHKETGGRLFEVSKKEPVDQIYSQIQEELRNQYSLGYTPDRGGAPEPGYHKIQVAAKQKDIVVQAREGYYGN